MQKSELNEIYELQGVDLWSPEGVEENLDLVVKDGLLVSKQASQVQRDRRLAVMPAGVDVQVHLRVPGQEQKESAETGLKAALCGGYAAVLSMPNTTPVIDSPQVIEEAQSRVAPFEKEFGIRAYFTSAVTQGQKGKQLVNFAEMVAAGAKAFTDDGLGVESDQIMAEAFEQLQNFELALLQHAEFPGHGGVLAPGSIQKKLGVQAYDSEPEIRMLKRDLELLRKFPKARYHLLHTTSGQAIPLLKEAKEAGLRVTGEVSPHHLFFNSEQIDPLNTAFKMNPPIRSAEDQSALLAALIEGTLDFVATDHAPHTQTDKGDDFDLSAFGTLGLETTLPVLFDFYQKGLLYPERIVQIFSSEPARFLGLEGSLGNLHTGRAFRAVVVNPNAEKFKYTESKIHSKSFNSCFIGSNLPEVIVAHFTDSGVFSFGDFEELRKTG